MIEYREIEISSELYLTTGECGILPVEQYKWSNTTQITIPLILHRNTEYLRYDNNETMNLGYIVFDCAFHKTKNGDNLEISLNCDRTDSIIKFTQFVSSDFILIREKHSIFGDDINSISDEEQFGVIIRDDYVKLIKVISDLINQIQDELLHSVQLDSLLNPTTTTI